MMENQQKPSAGRIVHYRVTAADLEQFHQSVGNKYTGNVREGSVVPAVITAVFSDTCVNLKVLADGPRDAWVTSRSMEEEPEQLGRWFWPPRA